MFHFFQRFVIVGAHDIGVHYGSAYANAGPDTDH